MIVDIPGIGGRITYHISVCIYICNCICLQPQTPSLRSRVTVTVTVEHNSEDGNPPVIDKEPAARGYVYNRREHLICTVIESRGRFIMTSPSASSSGTELRLTRKFERR